MTREEVISGWKVLKHDIISGLDWEMAADWCLRTQGNGTETYLKQHWRTFPNLPVSGGWASWSGAGASSTTRSWSSLSAPEERGRRQSADPQCRLKSRVEHLSPELSRSWQVQNLSSDNCGGGGAHPRSAAGSNPPGPAGCSRSAGRSSAQTSCGGSAWRRGACSIFLLLPPLSPRTSPTCKDERKSVCCDIQSSERWNLPACASVLTWQTLSTLIHPPRAEACPFRWRSWEWGHYRHRPECGAVVLLQATLQHNKVTWSRTEVTQSSAQVPLRSQ